MKKRIIAVLVLLVLMLGLVSCSSNNLTYDKITSVFIRLELPEEDELTSFLYSVTKNSENGEIVFNALSFNLDGSITELTNYPVDEAFLEDTRDFCREYNVLDAVKEWKPSEEHYEWEYTDKYYTVTLQFEDGTELYTNAHTDWLDEMEQFFVNKIDELF